MDRGHKMCPWSSDRGHIFWPGALWLGAHNKGFFPTILTRGHIFDRGQWPGAHCVPPVQICAPGRKKHHGPEGGFSARVIGERGLTVHIQTFDRCLPPPQTVLSVALPYSRLVYDFTSSHFHYISLLVLGNFRNNQKKRNKRLECTAFEQGKHCSCWFVFFEDRWEKNYF